MHFLLWLVVLVVVKIWVVLFCVMMLCILVWGYNYLEKPAAYLEDGAADSSKILVLSAKLRNGHTPENHTLLLTIEGRFFFTSILVLIYY
jgi:hypothetical protein